MAVRRGGREGLGDSCRPCEGPSTRPGRLPRNTQRSERNQRREKGTELSSGETRESETRPTSPFPATVAATHPTSLTSTLLQPPCLSRNAPSPRARPRYSLTLSLSLSLCSLFSVDRALFRSSLSSRSLERPLPRAYIAAKLSLSPSSPIANRAFTIPLFSPLPFSVLCLSCTRLLVYPKVCVRRPSFSPLATHSSARPVSPSVPFYRAQTTGLPSRSRLIPPNLGYLRHPATDPNPWRPFALSRGCESRGVYLYGWRTSKPSERTNQRSRL